MLLTMRALVACSFLSSAGSPTSPILFPFVPFPLRLLCPIHVESIALSVYPQRRPYPADVIGYSVTPLSTLRAQGIMETDAGLNVDDIFTYDINLLCSLYICMYIYTYTERDRQIDRVMYRE